MDGHGVFLLHRQLPGGRVWRGNRDVLSGVPTDGLGHCAVMFDSRLSCEGDRRLSTDADEAMSPVVFWSIRLLARRLHAVIHTGSTPTMSVTDFGSVWGHL